MDRVILAPNGTLKILTDNLPDLYSDLMQYGAVQLGPTDDKNEVYLLQGRVIEVIRGKEKLTAISNAGK